MKVNALKGRWALVTGASSGIGQEFCMQLARAGLNVVLVARRRDRLDAVAASAHALHGVETCVIQQDLGVPEAAAVIHAAVAAKGIRVSLLINNAGIGHWGRFEGASGDAYSRMIGVNVTAMVTLCRVFLADLAAAPPGGIINVASSAAYQPVPYMAAYAATKAFVLSFSQALHGELESRGILVQALVPGPTKTEFDSLAGGHVTAIKGRAETADVVKAALSGFERGGPVALAAKGAWKQRVFAGLFPPRLVVRKVGRMFEPPKEG